MNCEGPVEMAMKVLLCSVLAVYASALTGKCSKVNKEARTSTVKLSVTSTRAFIDATFDATKPKRKTP